MKRSLFTLVLALALLTLGDASVWAAGPQDHGPKPPPPAARTIERPTEHASAQRSVAPDRRREVFGAVAPEDRAWTTYGDVDGLHVLTAVASDGYVWHGVATLGEPGFEGDTWVGHGCLIGDDKTAVVTYAPRMFTNKPAFFGHGGFVATVDLTTGAVKKLPVTSSLSYFTPSCGSGLDAVLTQDGGEEQHGTRLIRIHGRSGAVDEPVRVSGQLTSALPLEGSGFVAASSAGLVTVDGRGRTRLLTRTADVAFDLAADSRSRLVYLDRDKNTATARQIALPRAAGSARRVTSRRLATGPLTQSGVGRTSKGRVLLLGRLDVTAVLPSTVEVERTASKDAAPSTDRGLLVEGARAVGTRTETSTQSLPVQVDAVAGASGERVDLAVAPQELTHNASTDRSPVLQKLATASTGSPTSANESERTCSVARNDPKNQAMQPKPRQVEWAVDQAVRGTLTVQRPSNWKNLGMPAYTPQGLFPSKALTGGGNVPAQLFLGILAQESNLWQAPGNVTPGVTGNPLIGNYYGLEISSDSESPDHDWNVKWSEADCGYGVAQVTDGMRLAGTAKAGKPFAYQSQRAVALDYAANVAAGLQILQDKWNQVAAAGLTVNNGDPQYLENWYYAVWAYNTGFYPKSGASENDGAWGLGWANNPANPTYPANRTPFLDTTYADASHPERWPYPEKVLGFAGHPVDLLESPDTYVSAYRAAWWPGTDNADAAKNRSLVKPPVNQFCDSSNQCSPGTSHTGGASGVAGANAGPCAHKNSAGQYDLKCWYHQSTRWKTDCPSLCGRELLRFSPGYAYQDDGTAYPPSCTTTGLPSGALIIDDQPDSYAPVRPGCSRSYTSAGTFALKFATDSAGLFPSKIDFHQLGAGFNGHFWYAHTRSKELRNDSMRVTGTWTLNKSLNQWARVMVHLPDIGAQTQEANYIVNLGNGQRSRVILQRRRSNAWVSLGVFPFAGTPKVSLSSTTLQGDGPQRSEIRNEDIAFDAIAVQPLSAKPRDIVVSLGDSYSSGEGSSATDGTDFYPETDSAGAGTSTQNLCHRSKLAWSRKAQLAGTSASIGALSDAWSPVVEHDLLACSGALANNVLPYWTPAPTSANSSHVGQYGELPQLDRGFVDQDTTLVTLSIGGNDARFADVVAHCVKELTDACQNTPLPPRLPGGPVSTDPASVEVPRLIKGNVVSGVRDVLTEIHKRAPKAKIVLMGYPVVLEAGKECTLRAPLVSGTESTWIASMADLLDDTLKSTASSFNTGVGSTVVYWADPRPDFTGHGVCSSSPGILGITLATTRGEGVLTPYSHQSFHPNAAGQQLYATTLDRALRQLGR